MLANDIRNYRASDFSNVSAACIAHHGILGMKWGVRRYQNLDGSLTDEGKRRIQAGDSKVIKDIAKERTNNMYKNMSEADLNKRKEAFKEYEEKYQKFINAPDNTSKEDRKKLQNDPNESSQKLAKLREDDIKKIFGDLDLSDYYLKRDIDSAFADVSDKYIYTPVRNSMKKESGKEKDYEIKHSGMAEDVYCALFEDDDPIVHSDVYQALFGDDNHLEHHGILGMKWGIRRFQNPDGTRTAAGKARYNEGGEKPSNPIKTIGDTIKKSKTDKQRKAALEKAREAKRKKAEEAKAAEQHEADKKKALESGDYKQIHKYANEVSTAELRTAMDRARTLSDLNQEVEKRTPKEKDIWSTIDDVANKVGTATNAFNKGKDAWNAFAKAANTFLDEDSMLPEIGTNFAEQKEKRAKERSEAERKNKVDKLSKSLDPQKLIDNQELFTKSELAEALGRITTYNSLKKEKEDRNTAGEKAIKEAEDKAKDQVEQNRKDKVDKLIKKGDFSEILKNKDLFTNDELKSAINRSDTLDSIDQILEKSKKSKTESTKSNTTSKGDSDWFEFYNFPNDDNGSKAKKTVDDIWEVVNNPKSTNASDSELSRLLLTSIWDID